MHGPHPPFSSPSDPHANQLLLTAGPPPAQAMGTLILLHGRGATAQSMLSLPEEFDVNQLAIIAPQAAANTWYPHSFLAPLDANQPWLDSALRRIGSLVSDLLDRGIPSHRIAILGFSQGACLATEFVARHPRQYGAVMALSGGLIGPPGSSRHDAGSLDGTPIFLGCGDPDPHIPFERVYETQAAFTRMHARVDLRRYPGMGHTINSDELTACRSLLVTMVEANRA